MEIDVEELLNKIPMSRYTYLAYGEVNPVNKASFIQLCRGKIEKSFELHGEDIQIPIRYAWRVVKCTALSIRANENRQQSSSIYSSLCPACRHFGHREFLVETSPGTYSCEACKFKLLSDISSAEALIRNVFVNHSSSGYKCTCDRFIPESYFSGDQPCKCPYNCGWEGTKDQLKHNGHKKAQNRQIIHEIDRCHIAGTEMVDLIQVKESIDKDDKLLASVLDSLISRYSKLPSESSIKKLLMAKAFKNIFIKYKDDMISYLVKRISRVDDVSIQSKIFQEFICLVENSLPFDVASRTFGVNGVYSLLDKRLDLFLGQSIYESTVRDDLVIPNETMEQYVGGRSKECYGPCFIGKLISVENACTGEKVDVDYYTLTYIKAKCAPGTRVKVCHYRVPSHYEMMGMMYLQRTRKHIVSKVQLRK